MAPPLRQKLPGNKYNEDTNSDKFIRPWFRIHLSTLLISTVVAWFLYEIQGLYAWRSGAHYWGWPFEAYANNSIKDFVAYARNLGINVSILMAFSITAEMLARRTRLFFLKWIFEFRNPGFRNWLHPFISIPCILALGLFVGINALEYSSRVRLNYGDSDDPFLSIEMGERDVKGWPFAYRQRSRTPGNPVTYSESEALVGDILIGLFIVLLAGAILENLLKKGNQL